MFSSEKVSKERREGRDISSCAKGAVLCIADDLCKVSDTWNKRDLRSRPTTSLPGNQPLANLRRYDA